MTSVATVVNAAVTRLCEAGLSRDEARRDVVVLARSVLGWSLEDWLVHSVTAAPETFSPALDALVRRRQEREPVAYLLGEKEFYGRPFKVTRHTLIPRPETEGLVDAALAWLRARSPHTPDTIRVVDVGTGTGCVAISIALEIAHASRVTMAATDISLDAIAVARDNAHRLGATAVTFRHGSLLAALPTPVDLVVSNPPYVAAPDRETLAPEVARYEPPTALFAGNDGLDVIRRLVPAARGALSPGGALMMEIGIDQADLVCALLETGGFGCVERHADLQGITRIVVGHLSPDAVQAEAYNRAMASCLFCRMVSGEVPSQRVYEDASLIAFDDINPQAPMHVLVVPKIHIATLNELSAEHDGLAGSMIRRAAAIAQERGFAEGGFRTVFNCNADAGQTVFHIHLHVLGGRAMTWPPG